MQLSLKLLLLFLHFHPFKNLTSKNISLYIAYGIFDIITVISVMSYEAIIHNCKLSSYMNQRAYYVQ